MNPRAVPANPQPPAVPADPATPPDLAGRPRAVGPGFVTRYALSYLGTCLLLIAPVAVTLALKVNDLVGTDDAPAASRSWPVPGPLCRWSATRCAAV